MFLGVPEQLEAAFAQHRGIGDVNAGIIGGAANGFRRTMLGGGPTGLSNSSSSSEEYSALAHAGLARFGGAAAAAAGAFFFVDGNRVDGKSVGAGRFAPPCSAGITRRETASPSGESGTVRGAAASPSGESGTKRRIVWESV